MGKCLRCLTRDATVMALAMDTTDIVGEAERIHGTSAVVTAALGRLLTAASMMGILLKGQEDTVTLNIDGGGSSTLYFNGRVLNNPTTNGRRIQERSVSDIVYIGY